MNPYLGLMRAMSGLARDEFREAAKPYLLDDELRTFAVALEKAIGEISPDEALTALRKMAVERGHRVA